ncbi:hypothetical protein P9112_001949 [Eukaryota sp. TZLM1-RC]
MPLFNCCFPSHQRSSQDPVQVVELRKVLSRLGEQFPHSLLSIFHHDTFLCQFDPGECPSIDEDSVALMTSSANQLVTAFCQSGQPHLHVSSDSITLSLLPLCLDYYLVLYQKGSFLESFTIDGPEIEARSLPFIKELITILENKDNDHNSS